MTFTVSLPIFMVCMTLFALPACQKTPSEDSDTKIVNGKTPTNVNDDSTTNPLSIN